MPMSASNFYNRSFKGVAQRAGLPWVTFHALRHTAATLLIANGSDIKVVQEVLGHAKASMTTDVYAHFLPGRADAEMQKLGELL